MKNISWVALAAIVGLVNVSPLKASSDFDLILGVTQQGVNSSGNDFMLDIGPVNPYPGASGLSNGETWNLNSISAFTSQNFAMGKVQWGIIGDANASDGANPEATWATTSGLVPGAISDDSAFGAIETPINSIEQQAFGHGAVGHVSNAGDTAVIASTDLNGWNQQTISSTAPSAFVNAYVNPNVAGTNVANTLWQTLANNSAPTKIGTFTLSATGILTFSTGTTITPPAPLIVSVARSGNTSTIFFATTNGTFTYTLYYTNATGLTAPITSWATSPTTLVGNGLTNSLSDATATTNRFYRIGVH
jgi:hypothetical protein